MAQNTEKQKMKRKRRHLSAEFKALVATEALKNVHSVNELAQKHDIAPAQVSQWKKELESRMVELFEGSNESKKQLKKMEKREAQMERKVGQLVLEKDFLLKKCEQLGIDVNEKP